MLETPPEAIVGILVDLENSTVNPSLALIYNLSPELSAFGKYSTAFRSPTHSELNTAHGNRYYGYYYLSNPDLKPETSDNYELGLYLYIDTMALKVNDDLEMLKIEKQKKIIRGIYKKFFMVLFWVVIFFPLI